MFTQASIFPFTSNVKVSYHSPARRCPGSSLTLTAFEDGGGEGRRRTGNLSLASVAAGHSLVAPCGLENSKEAGGVSQGGGEGTPSQSSTGCNRAGRRKWLGCGRVFDYWDVRGGCQWSSTCAHVNRTEGGVRPQAKTPSGV